MLVMTVLLAVPSLDPGHGGPSRTVVALADALARQAPAAGWGW